MAKINFNWIDRDSLALYRAEALQLWISISENKNNLETFKQDYAKLRNKIHNLGQVIGQQEKKYLEITHKAFGINENGNGNNKE